MSKFSFPFSFQTNLASHTIRFNQHTIIILSINIFTSSMGFPRAQDDIVQLTAILTPVIYSSTLETILKTSDVLVCSKNSIHTPKNKYFEHILNSEDIPNVIKIKTEFDVLLR